jgi:uncharacterized damage-inducible protein DinB
MDLSYPIGPCEYPTNVSAQDRARHIADIAALPQRIKEAIQLLDDSQLDAPYRPGGWTVRQVVHHYVDSHVNAYVRFRLALTEDEPTIKPYDEKKWAELTDARTGPVQSSLEVLEGLHRRWVSLLTSLSDQEFARTLNHPESGVLRLDTYLASYGWHSRHHVAQITSLRNRMGWK